MNQEMKNQVIQTLKECKSTNCTHPSVKMIRKPHVDIEPYRTRNACGIKVARSFFSSDKAKGSGKAHVTYFSGQTPCFYSNFKLAELWVKQWEQLGKPDPLSEEMTKFVAKLKASHAAAVTEHQGEPATNS